MRGKLTVRAALATTAAALLVAGCGSGPRQDADEAKRAYSVEVTKASFPKSQSIAQTTELRIKVKNTDSVAIPNVAVTVETKPPRQDAAPGAFSQAVDDPRLADNMRPIWIVNEGPSGGDSAFTNSWVLGPLRAGATKTFRWQVTAVKTGSYEIFYKVSPSLDGKASATSDSKGLKGSFDIKISGKPRDLRVAPGGKVVGPGAGDDQSPAVSGGGSDPDDTTGGDAGGAK